MTSRYILVGLTGPQSGSTLGTEMVEEFGPTEKQEGFLLVTASTNSELTLVALGGRSAPLGFFLSPL